MIEPAPVDDRASIAEQVRASLARLTAQERKAAQVLLANYPAAGLAPVAEFAGRARVSAPTVLRFVAKLGYGGLSRLPATVARGTGSAAGFSARQARASAPDPASHERAPTDPFAEAAVANIQGTFRHLPEQDFSAMVEMICDRRRSIHLLGGRFTDALARYLAAHLSLVRPDVRHVPSGTGVLRDRLLDLRRRDVLIVFDIRRYQDDVVAFGREAAARGAEIVLLTDQWISPLSRQAKHVVACRVAAPSRWDSAVALLAVVEALTAAATERLGDFARKRIEDLERLR